jgi:O-antigen/teichoic acid export membrane protein
MSFSLNVVAARFVWYAYDSSDKLIVGKLLNDRALGFYTMAVRFTMELSGRLLTIINQVAFPIYSRLQEDPRRLKGYFLRASQLVSSVTFPAFAGIFLVADVAVPALLTDKWLPIVQPLKILCFVTMTTSVGALIGPAVLARDRADLAVKYNLLCLCVMPAGFCFGTRWGVAGVCGAWALLYPFLVMFWYGLTRKLIGYEWHELVRAYKPATVSTIAMLALTFGVRWLTHPLEANLVKLTAIIGAGAASYIAVFALGFREQLTEVRELFSRSQPAARVT